MGKPDFIGVSVYISVPVPLLLENVPSQTLSRYAYHFKLANLVPNILRTSGKPVGKLSDQGRPAAGPGPGTPVASPPPGGPGAAGASTAPGGASGARPRGCPPHGAGVRGLIVCGCGLIGGVPHQP